MDAFIDFLAQYGYVGMFVASFIAGSVFPFSSEAVMVVLQVSGADPLPLFISATIGNVGGSMFNYGVGRLGKPSWRNKLLPKDPKQRARQERIMEKYGAWAGVLCFIPILGSAIAVMMGFMRCNPWLSLLAIFIGKAARYAILIFVVSSVQ
ncbi:MAG: DedA family protein [Bacteroidales bacterium]|nr:DedA family protein [Candidatus Physcousia equi]